MGEIISDKIHLNPVRARMVSLDQRLFDFPWSSYRHYVRLMERPPWLVTEVVLGALGLRDDADGRSRYAQRMRSRAVEELAGIEPPSREDLRRGWCLGSAGFRERMLTLLDTMREKLNRAPGNLDGSVRQSHDEEEAERLFSRALLRVGLRSEELDSLRKGDVRKLATAALIKKRTTVSNAWIAEKLHLGHPSRVSHSLERMQNEPIFKDLEEAL